MRKQLRVIMLMSMRLLILMFSVPQAPCKANDDLSIYLQDVPFPMGDIAVPVFPENDINIINYGADGKYDLLLANR